jgi:hypothetical protein
MSIPYAVFVGNLPGYVVFSFDEDTLKTASDTDLRAPCLMLFVRQCGRNGTPCITGIIAQCRAVCKELSEK